MSVMDGSTDLLKTAFDRFQQAAVHLQEHHVSLQSEVERLEGELLDAHRRLEAVLDSLDGGVAVISPDGILERTNRAFERLGLGAAGTPLSEPELLQLVSAGGSGAKATRIRRDGGDGIRDLAVSLIPVGDQEGALVLSIQDVTEIRREEEEGGRRHRLEALGRMGAELAHEVRNPLGSIRLFAEMLQEDLAGNEIQREMIDQILAATSGLESTVTNLLAFASPSRGSMARVDAADLAREACALLQPSCALRNIALEGPAAEESHCLTGDTEGLRQVVLNLLGNALAATPGGGAIRVRTGRESGTIVLEVTDSGKGISPEDLPRVFDPFFSRTDGGTGLGLSIVHGIVERHRGSITLDSTPGNGTRVRVEIPEDRNA
jgi:signal transduction histidine kinase